MVADKPRTDTMAKEQPAKETYDARAGGSWKFSGPGALLRYWTRAKGASGFGSGTTAQEAAIASVRAHTRSSPHPKPSAEGRSRPSPSDAWILGTFADT